MKKFKYPVNVLIEYAGTFSDQLKTDLSDFTKFDSSLDTAKMKVFEDCIVQARLVNPDRIIRSVIADQTDRLNMIKNEGAELCIKVFYFAEKKFAAQPAVLKEFGVQELPKVRNSQPKLALFMNHLAGVVEKYRSDLISVGANEGLLNNVMPMAEMVESGNINQEVMKKSRLSNTRDRYEKLNAVYDMLKEFNKASKIVYAKDPMRRAKYNMPKSKRRGVKGNPPTDEQSQRTQ